MPRPNAILGFQPSFEKVSVTPCGLASFRTALKTSISAATHSRLVRPRPSSSRQKPLEYSLASFGPPYGLRSKFVYGNGLDRRSRLKTVISEVGAHTRLSTRNPHAETWVRRSGRAIHLPIRRSSDAAAYRARPLCQEAFTKRCVSGSGRTDLPGPDLFGVRNPKAQVSLGSGRTDCYPAECLARTRRGARDADARDQDEQVPPSASARVMQPADRNSNGGKQDGQRIEGREGIRSLDDLHIDECQKERDDHANQIEHPELGPTRSPVEIDVLLQYIKIPVHGASLMVDPVDMVE